LFVSRQKVHWDFFNISTAQEQLCRIRQFATKMAFRGSSGGSRGRVSGSGGFRGRGGGRGGGPAGSRGRGGFRGGRGKPIFDSARLAKQQEVFVPRWIGF